MFEERLLTFFASANNRGSCGRQSLLAREQTELTQHFYHPTTVFCKNVFMSDQRQLTLQQVDQARTDFALIDSNLELIMGQLSRLPTRGDLAKTALGIIFCTAVVTTLLVWLAWH